MSVSPRLGSPRSKLIANKVGRGKKGKASETDGFSQSRLKAARATLRHSSELSLLRRRVLSDIYRSRYPTIGTHHGALQHFH
jgi:hypothetical protein